jgi:L-ascorbate metabolism protein UlaG (beta-lactamase superfamily)
VVLVSHLHHDHLDLGSLRLLGQPRLIVPRGARAFLRSHGFRDVIELAPGETSVIGGTTITATPARHSGSRRPLGPTADAVGYVVETSRDRLYFAGDTDLFPGMADLGEIDVAFLPVWGWGPTLGAGHLDPERAARAAAMVRPRLAVPIHWGTFWPGGFGRVRPHRLTGPAAEFARDVAELAPGVEVSPTVPGDHVSLRRAHHRP